MTKIEQAPVLSEEDERVLDAIWDGLRLAFEEADHPRDDKGRFTSGGGGGGSGGSGSDVLGKSAPRGPVPEEFARAERDYARRYEAHNAEGKTTRERYKRPDGGYTAPRARLHRQIEDRYFEGKRPVPEGERPTVYLMGGGPASGKSVAIKSGAVKLPERAVTEDGDDIKTQLPEMQSGVEHGVRHVSALVHEESSDVADSVTRRALEGGYDLVVDGTGNKTVDNVRRKIQKFRASGHRVVANYITVPTEMAIERADKRGERTGRFMPHEALRQIHASVSKLVPLAIEEGLFDEFNLYDTSGGKAVRVASAEGSRLTVHDKDLWDAFLAKGH
jgi:predicted ABC-type ATPase